MEHVRSPGTRRPAGLGELLGHLFGEGRSLLVDYAQLAVLDARRAALNLAWTLGTVLVVAVLLVTAWMGLLAALIVWASSAGVSWAIAIAVAALVNIAAAAGLAWWMRHLVAELPFTALMRQLRGDPAPDSPDGKSAHAN
jgi:hypothetical protein